MTPVQVTRNQRRAHEQGSALIEFVLCSIVWLPLLLGTIFVGINVTRSIEVTQICRDAGHMHAYGVDFSQPANQAILVQLATGFSVTPTAGDGVFILSTVEYIGSDQCAAGGFQPDGSDCPNFRQFVFVRRLVVGNKGLRVSNYGTPPGKYIDSNGFISSAGYLTDSSTRVSSLPAALVLPAGQNAYLAETYFSSADLDWSSFSSNEGIYSSFIF